ncbi:type 1 glutamine amidotransferase domain-containing protein [Mycetocola tolaasinivorans]|uniref:Type 1 glutamine amidotransferase domain-containing protein n=1 Tax=Mycetocola tolaasinivorans TaxID=76635 RepID=A0A3L7ACY3_9MICO|nr:type 1 glutamine amidotransferase domain-containing protein [Mycetocola tolaasinivorans]RLP77844.1 type 1 glutamine amidotransferase domain-containing protein [Mycetocola tolaasinivorans]
MTNFLMVVTGAHALTLATGSSHPTGFWAEELIELHRGLTAAGHTVHFATPGGVRPPVDPGSLDLNTAEGRAFQAYLDDISEELSAPLVLAEVSLDDYAGVLLPGGHGPMADLAFDGDLGRLLVEAVDTERLVAVLCHGPAGLLSAIRTDGSFAFAGRNLTVFTDLEESQGGLGEASPYLVESRLRALGARVSAGAPWSSTVVVDGNLVSGQNPQSSVETAARVVAELATR